MMESKEKKILIVTFKMYYETKTYTVTTLDIMTVNISTVLSTIKESHCIGLKEGRQHTNTL